MRTEVKNQLIMLGNSVAAEVARRRPTHRRWLCISPAGDGILLIDVEVPAGLDPVDWPKDNASYQIVAREQFTSLEAALDRLRSQGIDTDSFDAIWKSENPF